VSAPADRVLLKCEHGLAQMSVSSTVGVTVPEFLAESSPLMLRQPTRPAANLAQASALPDIAPTPGQLDNKAGRAPRRAGDEGLIAEPRRSRTPAWNQYAEAAAVNSLDAR
jgi:hypothetical protein